MGTIVRGKGSGSMRRKDLSKDEGESGRVGCHGAARADRRAAPQVQSVGQTCTPRGPAPPPAGTGAST